MNRPADEHNRKLVLHMDQKMVRRWITDFRTGIESLPLRT